MSLRRQDAEAFTFKRSMITWPFLAKSPFKLDGKDFKSSKNIKNHGFFKGCFKRLNF